MKQKKALSPPSYLVSGQGVQAVPALHVPQPHGGVEAGRGEDEVGVGVVGAGAGGRPLDGVDLLAVGLEVVHAGVSVHAPHLEGHVVGARGEELALRVPFYRVYLKWSGSYYCKKIVDENWQE